jgi:3'-5' exoribonuclease
MVAIANFMAKHYLYVNKDLLVSGVLLHDAGKTMEYDTTANFDFTDDGRLIGHIARSLIMVEQAALELGNISEHDLRQLLHLIASHHGTLEWGSPILPKTLEAVLLHQIDMIDSRVQGFYDHVRGNGGGSLWTTKPGLMFGTELRRPPGFT